MIFEARGRFEPEADAVFVEYRTLDRIDVRVVDVLDPHARRVVVEPHPDGELDAETWSEWRPVELEPSLEHRSHSPDGFSWGYAGSGPSQLALAILLAATDSLFAVGHYQAFKFESIAKLEWPEPWQLRVDTDVWDYASSRVVSGSGIDTPGLELVAYSGDAE